MLSTLAIIIVASKLNTINKINIEYFLFIGKVGNTLVV